MNKDLPNWLRTTYTFIFTVTESWLFQTRWTDNSTTSYACVIRHFACPMSTFLFIRFLHNMILVSCILFDYYLLHTIKENPIFNRDLIPYFLFLN